MIIYQRTCECYMKEISAPKAIKRKSRVKTKLKMKLSYYIVQKVNALCFLVFIVIMKIKAKCIQFQKHTGCSFIIICYISKQLSENGNIKEIVLMSDNAEGQNKNYKIMFCSYLAIRFKVTVSQIFPVRFQSLLLSV